MRQAVHIFLKDSRQLRIPIAIALAWTAFFGFAGTFSMWSSPFEYEPWRQFLAIQVPEASEVVLPIAWWFLISQVFHAEALPGDRQFWLTRPYRRSSLLGAKALFVLAYVTLPMTLAMGAIVVGHGFPLLSSLPGILWAQVLILLVIVLPAAALASVTSTLVQFVVGATLLPVLLMANYSLNLRGALTSWGAMGWIRSAVGVSLIAAIATGVLIAQFTARRTGRSRLIALGGVLVLVLTVAFLPWRTAFALQARLAPGPEVLVTAELVRPERKAAPPKEPGGPIALRFRIDGPSAATPIACEAGEFTFEGPNGATWGAGARRRPAGEASSSADGCWFLMSPTGDFISAVGDSEVSIQAVLYTTVFGDPRQTTVSIGRPTVIPEFGVCSATRYVFGGSSKPAGRADGYNMVSCESALRVPRVQTAGAGPGVLPGLTRLISYSPFPADLSIQPLLRTSSQAALADSVTVATREPVAHSRIVAETRGVRLIDFY